MASLRNKSFGTFVFKSVDKHLTEPLIKKRLFFYRKCWNFTKSSSNNVIKQWNHHLLSVTSVCFALRDFQSWFVHKRHYFIQIAFILRKQWLFKTGSGHKRPVHLESITYYHHYSDHNTISYVKSKTLLHNSVALIQTLMLCFCSLHYWSL